MIPAPVIREHEGFLVVRDDLLPGGSKVRAAVKVISGPPQTWIYTSPASGYAQLALAIACRHVGHRAIIFTPARKTPTPVTRATIAAGADVRFVAPGYMTVLKKRAHEEAERIGPDATVVPLGLALPGVKQALTAEAAALPVRPSEVWVIGEVRGPSGSSRGLVSASVDAFVDAGMSLWNEAILITAGASTPIRAAKFPAARKLVRHHQHVLVFVKGDPAAANAACGSLSDLDLDLGADA